MNARSVPDSTTDPAPRLIGVGNVVIDITATVPELPERGDDVVAGSGGITAGGGFNVLVAALRLGLPAAYAGAHGTGPLGDLARAAMRREGIDILLPPVAELDTGFDVAITDAGGERTFITTIGAEVRLSRGLLAGIRVGPADCLHVSGYSLGHQQNAAAILELLGRVPAACTVLFDPGPRGMRASPAVVDAVLGRVDWWSGNLREAEAATGRADPMEAAAILAERCARGGVVVTGAGGCALVAGATAEWVPGFEVTAVDTNGAGDAHAGAFLAALSAGFAPAQAARRANAAAAIAVTRAGPATGPTASELETFLATRG